MSYLISQDEPVWINLLKLKSEYTAYYNFCHIQPFTIILKKILFIFYLFILEMERAQAG